MEQQSLKWYAVRTLTGQEGKVSQSLQKRIVDLKKTECFGDIVVPTSTQTSHANGKKRKVTKTTFPGYILVKMLMNNETWHLVKDTEKIISFIGGSPTKPQNLSEEEVAYMRGLAERKPSNSVHFEVGEEVTVVEGPFKSFVGTIDSIEKEKVRVSLSVFGRPTPVEVEKNQIEKL